MINDLIGNRIRLCRQQKALTQEALAEIICVSHQTVSKWENGLIVPDVCTLVKLSGIFQVSMDYLCGTETGEQEKIINDILQSTNYEMLNDFDELKRLNQQLTNRLDRFPLNDMLLNHQLHLLREMHDLAMNDMQKEYTNDLILICSEKILDISKNDEYRSYANYNMAIYYSEQPEDSDTLQKSREFADKVLYKYMYPGWYHLFGKKIDSIEHVDALHKVIDDSVKTIKSAIGNLARHYRREGNIKKYEDLTEFNKNFDIKYE